MDEDDFEAQFADELDALEDFDPEEHISCGPQSKKSLDFSTPSTVKKTKSLIAKDSNALDESLCITPLNKTNEESPATGKRKRSNVEYGDISDDENDIGENAKENQPIPLNLPDIVPPQRKKARVSKSPNQDEDNITPPPSPTYDVQDEIALEKQRIKNAMKNREVRTGEDSGTSHGPLEEYDFERPRVLKRLPTSDYVPITDNSGHRFYMSLKDEDELDEEMKSLTTGYKPSQLLGAPIWQMKLQLEEKRCAALLLESERLTQDVVSRPPAPSSSLFANESAQLPEKKPGSLWVDRYSPARYTELLSDEATNRVVLKWLKQWDCVVFGREKKAKPEKVASKENEKKFVPFFKPQQELTEELDQHNRPMFKAVLLSGPPGLGKTTLGHVIAQHAGYNVVEINASDDRSVDVFKNKLEAATQMKAVIGADPRPNCLVIDEIDGSPVATINVLLTLLKQMDPGGGRTATGKRKKRQQILLRPIICICNDLYVPALRQLRQNALVVSFPPTLPTQLAGRLLEICRKEDLRADLTTLLALCEKADNDIRSCLNTLQFVKGQARELQLHTINTTSLGQKDAHKSLFSTWQYIFKMPHQKRKRWVNPYDRGDQPKEILSNVVAQNNTSLAARFDAALDVTIAAGETEKITNGLFENYLESRVKDPRLHSVLMATDWLEFTDVINKQVGHSQNYTLMRYTSYLPVAFHLLFASNNPHKIIYPNSAYEVFTKTTKSQNLITTLTADVCPSVRKNLNVVVTVTEFLDPLLQIIQPTLRPVNIQLYSAREKADLKHLIDIMVAYNITYRQERTPDGQYVYVTDPNIEELIKYPDVKTKVKQMTYANKQLVAREIEVEKMRKSDSREDERMDNSEARLKSAAGVKKPEVKSAAGEKQLPNYKRQDLEVKPLAAVEEREYVDFFGRKLKRTTPEAKAKKDQKREETIGGEIWFKFHQGFSNAVRRTVRVGDFL